MSRSRVLLLVLFFVITRLVLVTSCADVFFYGEELAKGTAAKALIDGLPIPYHEIAYMPHEGGGFVIAHLKALAFFVVGESLLANKLVALVTAVLVLLAGLAFARECFGARTATVFGVLIALAPESWLRFSLLSLGTHFEALVFLTLVLRYTFRILRAEEPQVLDWAKLGLAAGFGFYFSLLTASAIAAAGIYLVFGLRKRLFCRGLAVACVCALIGLAPLFAMMSKVGLDALRVRGQDVGAAHGTSVFRSIADLFEPLRREGTWDDGVQLVITAVLVVLGAVLVRERSFRLQFLGILGFLALFVVLYLASGLAVGMDGHWFIYLRMTPVWFFATLLASAALVRFYECKSAFALTGFALLVAAGLADLVRLALTGRPDRPLANVALLARTPGYDYVEYFDKLVPRLSGTERAKVATLLTLHDDSTALPAAIAQSTFEHTRLPFDAVLGLCRDAFGARFRESVFGLGHALHPDEGYDVPAAFAALERTPSELRHDLAVALGRTGLGPRFRRDRLQEQIDLTVPAEYRADFLRGTGYKIYRVFELDPEGASEFVRTQHESDRKSLTDGLTLAAAAATLP